MLLHPLFLLLFTVYMQGTQLNLGTDIAKDWGMLQKDSRYFISDNASDNPSIQTIESDLQVIQVVAAIDLSNSVYSGRQRGNWLVHKWQFEDSSIKAIYQFERTVALDTVVTDTYLDNKAPTQRKIQNNFTFRSYAVSTTGSPLKFYYLTEQDQGLQEYQVEKRKVEINYSAKKEGLSDVLPKVRKELESLLAELIPQ